MSDIIFYLLYPLINTALYTCNLYILNDKILDKKGFLQYSILLYFSIVLSLNHDQLMNILILTLTLFFFKIRRFNIISYIISYILIMIILLPSDTLVGFFITNILDISYKIFLENKILRLFASFSILITSILISFILKKILIKINFDLKNIYLNTLTKKIILYVVIIFIVMNIALRLFTIISIDIIFDNLFLLYTLLIFILLIFLIIILYFLYKIVNITIQNDFIDKENKQLKQYTDMLEKMSTDLRKFKHDYINILYTLGDYINEGDINGLKNYYQEDLLPESKNIVKTDKNITLLKNIKITPLKALVSSKLLAAQSEGIEINAEVLEEVDKLSIKTIDICRIIGIFLDNAIESSILCNKKFIHFAMIKTEGNVIIVIMNSCQKNIPPVYELYKKNFSTKGTNRGIGLTSVKELIDSSYKNILLNTSANNGVFKQELIIKNCNSD